MERPLIVCPIRAAVEMLQDQEDLRPQLFEPALARTPSLSGVCQQLL
jgi:hypothetical protein